MKIRVDPFLAHGWRVTAGARLAEPVCDVVVFERAGILGGALRSSDDLGPIDHGVRRADATGLATGAFWPMDERMEERGVRRSGHERLEALADGLMCAMAV